VKLLNKVVMENTEDGHCKTWICELYKDKVVTRWGRIGYELQSKEFPGESDEFFWKKYDEKIKKGYQAV
jgi:predicted DNA-binding WGR domain protein